MNNSKVIKKHLDVIELSEVRKKLIDTYIDSSKVTDTVSRFNADMFVKFRDCESKNLVLVKKLNVLSVLLRGIYNNDDVVKETNKNIGRAMASLHKQRGILSKIRMRLKVCSVDKNSDLAKAIEASVNGGYGHIRRIENTVYSTALSISPLMYYVRHLESKGISFDDEVAECLPDNMTNAKDYNSEAVKNYLKKVSSVISTNNLDTGEARANHDNYGLSIDIHRKSDVSDKKEFYNKMSSDASISLNRYMKMLVYSLQYNNGNNFLTNAQYKTLTNKIRNKYSKSATSLYIICAVVYEDGDFRFKVHMDNVKGFSKQIEKVTLFTTKADVMEVYNVKKDTLGSWCKVLCLSDYV